MADDSIYSILTSAEQAAYNYSTYSDKYVDATDELVNSETFLSLLVAEMTNQDPLEPTSNTEFISQLATFSQMQYMKEASTYSMASYASSLVGKTATAYKYEGTSYVNETGVVESVSLNTSTNTYSVVINGVSFDLDKVSSISETVTESTDSTEETDTTSALADSISKASSLVGMYAFVSKTEDGVTTDDEGFITSIVVNDGTVSAVINDRLYAISDISQVTYAVIVDDEETDSTETVEETASASSSGSSDEQEITETTVTTETVENADGSITTITTTTYTYADGTESSTVTESTTDASGE